MQEDTRCERLFCDRGTPEPAQKWTINACPPVDFRTPLNAKKANTFLEEIAKEFGEEDKTTQQNQTNKTEILPPIPVSFLDTSLIIDPVWDTAEDWSHLNGHEGTQEIRYILEDILEGERKRRSQTHTAS